MRQAKAGIFKFDGTSNVKNNATRARAHLLHSLTTFMRRQIKLDQTIMMRREYIREPSLAAKWALPPAIFSLVLAIVATIAHRSGLLLTQNFLLVAATVFIIALSGFLLSMLGFYALWTKAAKGGRRSAWALVLSMPVLCTGLLAVFLTFITAPLSDISTDNLDPPHFLQIINAASGENINEPPRINAQLQTEYYPNLTGRRYALATEAIVAHVFKQIVENGWQPAYDKPRYLSDGDWLVEATLKTGLFRFVDHIVVRITDEGNATYVDMRSASSFGSYDLGGNARRIEKFMKDLDTRVVQLTK
jgi:hypothetical protein